MIVAVAIVAASIVGSSAAAQIGMGTISGRVDDESGGVVPGAIVTVTNVDTGISRTAVTSDAGRYQVPGLIPGSYEVQVQLDGFTTAVRAGIGLAVGGELSIDLVLRVGEVEQTAVVTADAPLVNTSTSALSGLVDQGTVRNLPLNSRSFDQLIALQSTAPQIRNRASNPGTGLAAAYSVAGARPMSNLYMLDGVEMMGAARTTNMPGGALGVQLGVEGIREFEVLTSNYSAAYGKKAGGIVNVATRSGTNAFHGSGYEFFRNDSMDARNFFNPSPEPPPFNRNQFGVSLGGPIRTNRTFFFSNYEGLRQKLGLTTITIVPDDNARRGLLPDPANPGQFVNVGVAPSVAPYFVLFPTVNGRDFGDGSGEHVSSPVARFQQDYFLVRVDHKLTERDGLFGRYNVSDGDQVRSDANPLTVDDLTSRDQSALGEWKRAGDTLVNAFRVGFSRSRQDQDSVSTVPIDPSMHFLESASTVGSITFGTSGANFSALGSGGTGDQRFFISNLVELSDQVYYQRGAHSFQIGANVQRIQHNFQAGSSVRGAYDFPGLRDFLLGRPSRFRGPDPNGGADPTKDYYRWYFATYMQDDYKIRRNLTLNLGLRYEFATVPTETADRISNYGYQLVDGEPIMNDTPTVGSPFFANRWLNIAPRVGFVWDPAGDGKTSIRGGFGTYYDQIDVEYRAFTASNEPFFRLLEVENPSFPRAFADAAGRAAQPAPQSIEFELDTPTRMTWNLGGQRQLGSNLVVNASYVGSRGYHLSRRNDLNNALPEIRPDGTKFYAAGLPRRNPRLGGNQHVSTDADSWYHGLQLDLNQRWSNGLRYRVSYTYSKNIDTALGTSANEATGLDDIAQDVFDLGADRGLSGFDVRNNFVVNLTYDVPGRNLPGAAGLILGDWQTSTIVTMTDGTPFTAVIGFSRSRNRGRTPTDRPNLAPGASNNPVLGGPDRYFDASVFLLPPVGTYGDLGRSTLIAPGLITVDLNLVRVFTLPKGVALHVRGDVFNLLNRANFGLPDRVLFEASGQPRPAAGRITTTTTTARQAQLSVRLVF
jgi:hypothetical protein